jgi:hypothetical protein
VYPPGPPGYSPIRSLPDMQSHSSLFARALRANATTEFRQALSFFLFPRRATALPLRSHRKRCMHGLTCTSTLHLHVGMDSDRIRTDTNSDVTIYHILFRIRIRIRILSNTNTKRIFRIRIRIRILTQLIA